MVVRVLVARSDRTGQLSGGLDGFGFARLEEEPQHCYVA